jgi:hypothetical protein
VNIMDVIHRRRSVRDYVAEPLGEAPIRELIDAATWAPSARSTSSPGCSRSCVTLGCSTGYRGDAKAHMLCGTSGIVGGLRARRC